MTQVANTSPAPAFVMVSGDLTQATLPEQFQAVTTAIGKLGTIPYIPVAGNHDWGDGGVLFHQTFGPSMYSFDAGGIHFVVLDQNQSVDDMLAFLDGDRATVPMGTPTAACFHFPPSFDTDDPFVDGMRARGVTMIFSGHWHQHRILDWDNLINYNVSPFVMAGMDGTPGTYRVVTIDPTGNVSFEPHIVVEQPVLRLTNPLPDTCVPPGALNVTAAIEQGAVPITASISIDGATALPLTLKGGWSYSAPTTLSGEGKHTITLTVDQPSGRQTVQASFCTQNTPVPASGTALTDWPQFQNGPTHTGATTETVTPPLQTVWTATVGGFIRGGSPVLADGRLFVPVVDLGDGTMGGVVALDAATGATLWEHRVGVSVNNSPAVDGTTVLIALGDGTVQALDTATGNLNWTFNVAEGLELGPSNLYAAPTISDGVAYIGVTRNLAAIDLASGTPLWQIEPSGPTIALDTTSSSLAVKDGVVVGLFGRGYEGVMAFDASTGAKLWAGPADLSTATQASPVIVDDRVYTASSSTYVYQLDLMSGTVAWQTQLGSDGFVWGYWILGTPAWANGKLFVPTQVDAFDALKDDSGVAVWNLTTTPSVVHPVHYQATASAFTASPVVTGGLVWIGGADGMLRAVDAESGTPVWGIDLGAPILSGPVPAHPMLFAATWDGTVHALVEVQADIVPPMPTPPMNNSGCGILAGGPAGDTSALAFAPFIAFFVIALRRRRQRSTK